SRSDLMFSPLSSLSGIPRPPRSTFIPYTTLFRSADAIIKLNRAGVLRTLVTKFECTLPEAVYQEAVVAGKERLYPDAVAIEEIRSEEHTSELQSRENLVCRLLLEKKKATTNNPQL